MAHNALLLVQHSLSYLLLIVLKEVLYLNSLGPVGYSVNRSSLTYTWLLRVCYKPFNKFDDLYRIINDNGVLLTDVFG